MNPERKTYLFLIIAMAMIMAVAMWAEYHRAKQQQPIVQPVVTVQSNKDCESSLEKVHVQLDACQKSLQQKLEELDEQMYCYIDKALQVHNGHH